MKEEIRLMKGNEAFAHAAIRYGCDGYFGYPITPSLKFSRLSPNFAPGNLPEWWFFRLNPNSPQSIWYTAVPAPVRPL